MDAARGVICRGPLGPYPHLAVWDVEFDDVPSTVDLLQEDVFLRFLASVKSTQVDRKFVEVIGQGYVTKHASEISSDDTDRPTVFSTLTQTQAIAVKNNVWESFHGNLSGRKLLENGVTRWA